MTERELTIEMIKASTSIEKEIKAMMDEIPSNPESVYLRLMPWAKEVFKVGRQLNHSDKQISKWIRDKTRDNWPESYIAKTLRELTK
jgi:hypothetical protein